MKKSNQEILLTKGYTFIKENKETGWSQFQFEEETNKFTAFWIPNQLVGHLMNLHYMEEHIGTLQNIRNKEFEKLESLRKFKKNVDAQIDMLKKKVESQRKSIAYYKGERDTYKMMLDKTGKDLQARKKEYLDKIEKFDSMVDSISEENMRKSEDIELLTHRNKILTTICYFIGFCFVSLLVFLAL